MKIKRDTAIDFLRVAATAFIVMHHYTQVVFKAGSGFFYGGLFPFGRFVELFFIMSGYQMLPKQKDIRAGYSFKRFYLHRALRILPLAAISVLVYEVLTVIYKYTSGGILFYGNDLKLSDALFTMLGIQAGWFCTDISINSPLWFVSVLLLCNVWFYLINFVTARIGRTQNAENKAFSQSRESGVSPCHGYILMIFIGLSVLRYEIELPFFNQAAARGYYSFFTGALMANALSNETVCSKKATVLSGFIILITAFGYIYYGYLGALTLTVDEYWLTLAFFPAVIVFFKGSLMQRLFKWNGWTFLAGAAYNTYVWHILIDMIFLILLGRVEWLSAMPENTAMILNLIVCYITGIISFVVIEKPLARYIKKTIAA